MESKTVPTSEVTHKAPEDPKAPDSSEPLPTEKDRVNGTAVAAASQPDATSTSPQNPETPPIALKSDPAKCEAQIDPQELPEPKEEPANKVTVSMDSNEVSKVVSEDPAPSPPAPEDAVKETSQEDVAKEETSSVPKDPNVGRLVEQVKVTPSGQTILLPGEVQSLQDAEDRIPPRYNIQWKVTLADDEQMVIHQDAWLPTELNADAPPAGNLGFCFEHLQARFQQALEKELLSPDADPILAQMVLYAAMEEVLQTNLQQQQSHDGESSTFKIVSKSNPHPPLYYTSNPSSYLQAPTATNTSPTATDHKVTVTPASLAQRVRSGCTWAHKWLVEQMPTPPPPVVSNLNTITNSSSTYQAQGEVPPVQRRSSRQPKPILSTATSNNKNSLMHSGIPKPTPVQSGGRVAMWWIQQLEQEENVHHERNKLQKKKPQEQETEEQENLQKSPKTSPYKSSTPNKQKITSPDNKREKDAMDVQEEVQGEDDLSTKQEEDDEDFASKDASSVEDEELEDVEKERHGTLSPIPDASRNKGKKQGVRKHEAIEEVQMEIDDEEGEEMESEKDLQQAIVHDNPFLKPNLGSLLEYLARPKVMTSEMLQKAVLDATMRIKFNKRNAAVGLDTASLLTVDQVVLDQETPDYPTGKVVLKCIGEESYSELQKMDPQAFSRCKFALDVIGDEESAIQTQRKQELILQEIQFKEEKAWSKWRHKGIHEGYANWPSWQDAIAQWVKDNVQTVSEEIESAPEEIIQDDEALAKSLEEVDDSNPGRRRTVRRAAAAASEGVYYGNQSSLTQKQLMDALVRLIKSNSFHTLIRLQSLVGDDSSDPIRRCRVALGRLVWKRNTLLRKPMDTDLSDAEVVKLIANKPLLSILPPEPEEQAGTEEAPQQNETSQLLDEEKALINYLQNLHSTELQLRRLITKNMAEIPLAIVATAADERPKSMENMDSADFEDTSAIEWHTTGHELLKKVIYRPASVDGVSTDMTPCFWYEIQDYSKPIESEAEDKEEPESKQRRMRFRAVPIPPPGEQWAEQDKILLLTEAQVYAGAKAAEMEKKQRSNIASDGNPFSGASGDKVTLIPVDAPEAGGVTEIHGRIVGYDNVMPEDDDEVEYRILFLPEASSGKIAFWASLDVRADTSSYVCQPIGDTTQWYSIEQFDYQHGSEAHHQCESFLSWLGRQGKAGPFSEPVDPVALNIPTYLDVVKNPMDISTMMKKLENGQYSSILPGQTVGISPVSRMLNGPFRKDAELIFDNAMLFNPPDDWIYQAAAHLKKNALKKIADLSQAADQKVSGGSRFRQKRSVYVDDDSDADMYEYESDNDDDFDGGGRRSRKRKRPSRGGAQKDEAAARAIEHPLRLQNILRDATDLRGPFANLPINLSASSFSLPPRWSCRCPTAIPETSIEDTGPAKKRAQEMAELLELQKTVEANESAGLRRSTRSHDTPSGNGNNKDKQGPPLEYFIKKMPGVDSIAKKLPSNRLEIEVQAEKLHEEYYSKLFQKHAPNLSATDSDLEFGFYSNDSFPPYMGRVVPVSNWEEVSWEIRAPFVVPALRWVLRGLIQSGHLTAVEPMTSDLVSGVVLTNDIYYWDATLKPFETLDLRELQRKKRANQDAVDEESEDEVELSEYEKARAQRVARNADRLRALGLMS